MSEWIAPCFGHEGQRLRPSSRDLSIRNIGELPDVFTTYRKQTEPLRERPRRTLPKPTEGSLPTFLGRSEVPPQAAPFVIPEGYSELEDRLLAPLKHFLAEISPLPDGVASAHPFRGGEDSAQSRLHALLRSEVPSNYKATRNGLLGSECSTKLSA